MKARRELNACLYAQKMDGNNMPEYYSEFSKYSEVQSGDIEAVEQKLHTGELVLISDMRILSESKMKNVIYHFVVAASTIARACMEGGLGHDEAYTLADIYIRKADKCKNEESVCELYKEMCHDFTERMSEIRKESVISLHIRKCIDYIYENLGSDLSVKTLAKLTGLNPTYLSRLFSKETGISIKQFITEAKSDTAQNLLKYSDLTYSGISETLGFSSQSAFIAVFKKITGFTPKVYREQYYTLSTPEKLPFLFKR